MFIQKHSQSSHIELNITLSKTKIVANYYVFIQHTKVLCVTKIAHRLEDGNYMYIHIYVCVYIYIYSPSQHVIQYII